jgi:hypothetical protein
MTGTRTEATMLANPECAGEPSLCCFLACRGKLSLAPLCIHQGFKDIFEYSILNLFSMIISPEWLLTGDHRQPRVARFLFSPERLIAGDQLDQVISPRGLLTGMCIGMNLFLVQINRDFEQT